MHQSVSIPLVAETASPRGNATPLLHELRHALVRLIERGESTILDLRSLPLAEQDLRELEETLGRGEVEATVHADGISRVRESRFPGIWWVEHGDEEGNIVARLIEVTEIPALLKSQTVEVTAALEALQRILE